MTRKVKFLIFSCVPPNNLTMIWQGIKAMAIYQMELLASSFRAPGFRISLSSMLTIWLNLGLSARSFCQQSSISWWRDTGQSIGGGRRYPSSIAFITWERSSEWEYTGFESVLSNGSSVDLCNFTVHVNCRVIWTWIESDTAPGVQSIVPKGPITRTLTSWLDISQYGRSPYDITSHMTTP